MRDSGSTNDRTSQPTLHPDDELSKASVPSQYAVSPSAYLIEGGTFVSNVRSHFGKKRASLWMVLAIFLLTVLFVNPIRETALGDDWAYALTVRHLLETGKYQLHTWAAVNMPFQIYWGGLFARLLGYSFSSLRISTLFLAFFGLIAFYYLAKEHGLDDIQAGLLTLGLLASPLVLCFSFNFMTDVPFLACLIIALCFYTRAIRLHSYPLMLLASMAASAAILTRQLGVALIGGLLFLWVLSKARKQQALFFLTGLTVPIIAGLWQLSAGILRPNLGAQFVTLVQSRYFANPGAMLTNMLWRLTVILQYLAFFSLPFVFLALLAFLDDRMRKLFLTVLIWAGLAMSALAVMAEWLGIGLPGFALRQTLMLVGGSSLSLISWWLLRSPDEFKQAQFHALHSSSVKFNVILPSAVAIYILTGMLYGRFANHRSVLMPYLQSFAILQDMGRLERGILTLVTSLGAILFARIFILRYSDSQGWRRVSPSERLIDLVTLFLLILELVFCLFDDRYLFVFLPFTLIVVGRHLRSWLNRFRITTAIACLAMLMLVASAMWTRGLVAVEEALWQGCEFVRSTGMQPKRIYGSGTWICYYRFQDYVAEVGDPTLYVSDLFVRWLPEQRAQREFWITISPDALADEKWEVLDEIPYRDILLRERRVYVVRRQNKGH